MRLALIYSGGTIGCAGTPLAPLPSRAFQALWGRHVAPRLEGVTTVDWQWLDPALDSSEMTPANWAELARLVLDAREEQAVLMLHGTDTMAWSAAALAFLLTLYGPAGQPAARLAMPVVLTGSQRPLFEDDAIRPGTDALANIEAGLRACGAGQPGVMVAFGGAVLPGTRAMKMSTSADRAFESPKGEAPCPELPAADPAEVAAQLTRLAPHLGAKAVLGVIPNPTDPRLLAAGLAGAIDRLGDRLGAIHLNGYGIGNFPARDGVAPLLRAAHDRGVLIAAGSQVPYGNVDPSTYGAGHWLAGCGAIATADMATAAVHAKLHVALALQASMGWDRTRTERFFTTPVAGELRS
ncbi:MAG TPA: asparaginase domain-containing protein [Thermohalobaculum sp.]|nr:asparaginase domain-containing protein [Thermohalobaculum sp.]